MKKFRTTPEVKKLEQHSEHKDAELIMRLKKGDDKALECLFKYRDELLKYLLSITHSVEESEDIIQDVFMTVWDNRENIDEKKNFKSYIFKIAKNRMIDMYRKFSKTEPLQPDTVA
ncbi:MAG: RNA polymerase sigma factor, partial [Prevotellaceae bacterium]|nr:RNA polymerase sigma factor [Prevotellaceae bacterium]